MISTALSSLRNAAARTQSAVCCGLDLDQERLPRALAPGRSTVDRILAFAAAVAATTYPYVCCYKVQKAFLECVDAPSPNELVAVVRQHASNTPIVLDAKLGDVEHTLDVYLATYFGTHGFDGVVLNPYMGLEVTQVMRRWPEKLGFILVRTSNPGSTALQSLPLRNGEALWVAVLRSVISEWERGTPLVPILSAFDSDALNAAATMLPSDMPVFLAGVGAQGASPTRLRPTFGNERQLVVNSSRGLIFPFLPNDVDWRDRIEAAAVSLRDALRSV